MRLAALALLVAGLLAQAAPAHAQHGVPLAATYQATPPASVGAGTDTQVQVTVTNTGDETWGSYGPPQLFAGVGQVAISYHWYDAAGKVVVWDGLRTGLGNGVTVAPQASATVTATVRSPGTPGSYQLRLALVREGIAWAAPSQPFAASAVPAYGATFTATTIPPLVTAQTYTLPVTVKNAGTATWTAAGANPIAVSYHWHDASGTTVVWDGLRTPLAADVAPNATATIQARVIAPSAPGTYTLTFDLVREGVAWFGSLGSTTGGTQATVAPITYGARYTVGASIAAYFGETNQIPVTIANTGNVPWGGANPVNLAYHVVDSAGRAVVWDGTRTVLGDVAPGASKRVDLTYTVPSTLGQFTLEIEAVREGVAWFGSLGTPPVRLPLTVTSGYGAGYAATTTPALATIGATLPLRVEVNNYGPRPLVAGGPNPVRISYHLSTAAGAVVVWDGARGLLPADLPPGASASAQIDVQLPSRTGDYVIAWDLVQEGVAWLSQFGIATKREAVTVQPGVTFYGKGFGHGLGMSQYGAQGLATGAAGAARTGEQIVAYYYPGTTLVPIDPSGANKVIRVLLSQPSSQGRYSCGAAYFDGRVANLVSAGGFRVLNEGSNNAEIFRASPNVSVQLFATRIPTGDVVQVWNQATATPTKVYEGPGPVVTVPLDPTKPTTVVEKGIYRGNFRFTNLGNTLRVLNVLNYDDYTKGVVPLEMLKDWHIEAYKAQALAARTYAYSSYEGGKRDYDVLDDQSDQCYGGVQMRGGRVVESAITSRAVDLTAGKLITDGGQAIRAYFSSSSGGYTKAFGCWNNNVVESGGAVTCRASPPYLTAVADPADLAVSTPAPNRNASWTRTFTSAEIRQAVLDYRGIDIGTLLSVDLSNRSPAIVGHAVSVKLVGTGATVDLPADRLLRDHLFLRSTMVRLAPW